MAVKDVAIIGCGVSGLTAIKCCLDAGLNPFCFEQQAALGGVWNYTDEARPNLASVHKCTITNTSKLVTCFSDFPMPKEFPNYMPQELMHTYLEMYAKHFDLEKYVHFQTEVVNVERSADYEETGKWVVAFRKLDGKDSDVMTKTFNAVMVCTGHYSHPVIPDIPGVEKFKGVKLHSGDYRTFHPYVGKRVVIVGCSHSAGDIAVELSHHASQVYISTRSGCYMITRLGSRGQPVDFNIIRGIKLIPLSILLKLNPAVLNNRYNFTNFGLHPSGTLLVNQFPICNDELPHRIVTGNVKVKGDMKEITEDSVILKGGEVVNDVDVLVFATGFKSCYPFAKNVIEVKDDFYLSLHKHMFLPDETRHTLAVIGAVGVSGPVIPVCEMQARVAAEVFTGRCSLPSKADMGKEIAERENRWMKTGASKYNFMRVGYLSYLDELGEMIGAKPNLWSIFKGDPKLAYRCFFDTAVPAQYRLQGPNSWKDARKVIMTLREQYLCPLSTRNCSSSTNKNKYSILVYFLILVFIIVAMMLKA